MLLLYYKIVLHLPDYIVENPFTEVFSHVLHYFQMK